jgi:hypothetical protein
MAYFIIAEFPKKVPIWGTKGMFWGTKDVNCALCTNIIVINPLYEPSSFS